MRTIKAYTIDELCNEHKDICITTQKGVLIEIQVENGITFITFPYGNKFVDPKEVSGLLTTGIAVMPVD